MAKLKSSDPRRKSTTGEEEGIIIFDAVGGWLSKEIILVRCVVNLTTQIHTHSFIISRECRWSRIRARESINHSRLGQIPIISILVRVKPEASITPIIQVR